MREEVESEDKAGESRHSEDSTTGEEDSATSKCYKAFKAEIAKIRESERGQNCKTDHEFFEMLTNEWESLMQSTTNEHGAGVLSLNRARKDNRLTFCHETKLDRLFVEMPQLLEFKVDNVEDVAKNKMRDAARTMSLPDSFKDRQGNEYGCKSLSID